MPPEKAGFYRRRPQLFRAGAVFPQEKTMLVRGLTFLALILIAIILMPSGAHFFELPNKIGLARDPYFIVQNIYRGWALFGAVIFPALAVTAALAWVTRKDRRASLLAAIACLCIAASLGVFFLWVYPGNVATENWTRIPPGWMTLRRNWEYGHAASAILTFVAFCCVALTAVVRR
jgi:hypothetical protein